MASSKKTMNSIALCLPVYQKEEGIENLVKKVPKIINKIIVVVDEPEPGMLNALQGLKKKNKRLEIITNPVRKGVGSALRQAIDRACATRHNIFVVMAGNGKDDPGQIPRVVKPIIEDGCDYVQGSRYINGGVSENLPFLRQIVVKTLPALWYLLVGVKYTEVTNGFRAYKLDIFKDRKINIWQDWLDGYQLEYYLHYKATTGPYKFTEVPVSKIYRIDNPEKHTKIRWKDGWQILSPFIYLKLGLRK